MAYLNCSKIALIDTRDCGYNGTITKFQGKYMFFYRRGGLRMQPNGKFIKHEVELRFCFLNNEFQPVSEPVSLSTGRYNMDPRAVSIEDGILIFTNNDSRVLVRKMNATMNENKNLAFSLSEPNLLEVIDFSLDKIEKNWMPFDHDGQIYLIRSTRPYTILRMGEDRRCLLVQKNIIDLDWRYGAISGGTPPVRINEDEYLVFFHSYTADIRDTYDEPRQYYIGAYIFEAEPPFNITRITRDPLSWDGLLNSCSPSNPSRVLFPAGCFIEDENLIMSYGENDNWNFVIKLPLDSLLNEMSNV